jgi:UDP-2,3-diacylglucosamine pyrophosphatase LpxH
LINRRQVHKVKRTLFVISDQHLGGAPAAEGRPSFEMCPASSRSKIVEFIQHVMDEGAKSEVHLVLNGDLVDFLAERDFKPFTTTDDEARDKLRHIMDRTCEVWDKLATFVKTGAQLTILLGNHDVELSLPSPRRLLLDRLGRGQVDFIYDNQAVVEGTVLIEHGNSYDAWNLIPHDVLREVRSALSRRGPPPPLEPPAGSLMVARVMNPLKARYGFVDLLKPERAAVLPILAVLNPASMKTVPQIAKLAAQAAEKMFGADGAPLDRSYIGAAVVPQNEVLARDAALVQFAQDLAKGGDGANISAKELIGEYLERIRAAVTREKKDLEIGLLYKAFRRFAEVHYQAFKVDVEANEYIKPATAMAKRGFQVIVMGHTHLVKRVPLGVNDSVYLNAGTWADLMRVPDAILSGDEAEAKRQIGVFTDDLMANRIDTWRRQVPTFAQIELENGKVQSRDVFFFDGVGKVERVTDEGMRRLTWAA